MGVRSKMAVLSRETEIELAFETISDVPFNECIVELLLGDKPVSSGCSCDVFEISSCETEIGRTLKGVDDVPDDTCN